MNRVLVILNRTPLYDVQEHYFVLRIGAEDANALMVISGTNIFQTLILCRIISMLEIAPRPQLETNASTV